MEEKAKCIVNNYIKSHSKNVEDSEIFITWSCYTLGNQKYMIRCKGLPHYFEVTYNKRAGEWYLDVYSLHDNQILT